MVYIYTYIDIQKVKKVNLHDILKQELIIGKMTVTNINIFSMTRIPRQDPLLIEFDIHGNEEMYIKFKRHSSIPHYVTIG